MPFAYFSIMDSYKDLELVDAPVAVNEFSMSLVVVTIVCVVIFRLLV